MASVIADFLYEQGLRIFSFLLVILAGLIFSKAIIAIIIYKMQLGREKEK